MNNEESKIIANVGEKTEKVKPTRMQDNKKSQLRDALMSIRIGGRVSMESKIINGKK